MHFVVTAALLGLAAALISGMHVSGLLGLLLAALTLTAVDFASFWLTPLLMSQGGLAVLR